MQLHEIIFSPLAPAPYIAKHQSWYDGISLDKRPAKAHLELLVAASNKLRKFSWCINFAVFPNSLKTRKLSSSKIKSYMVERTLNFFGGISNFENVRTVQISCTVYKILYPDARA